MSPSSGSLEPDQSVHVVVTVHPEVLPAGPLSAYVSENANPQVSLEWDIFLPLFSRISFSSNISQEMFLFMFQIPKLCEITTKNRV